MSFNAGEIYYDIGIKDREYARALKRMESDADRVTGSIAGKFTKMAAAIGAGAMFVKAMGNARAFSRELANVQSIADDLDMRKVREEILNLNATLGETPALTNALYFAYSAGVRGTEKELVTFTGQVAKLAQTVGSDVTPVMDAVTTLMNAYNLKIRDTGRLMDWFYQVVKSGKTTGPALAQSLGMIASSAASAKIPLEQLGAGIATLTTTMPTSQAITSLNQAIMAFIKPTQEASETAAQYGFSMSAAALEQKGFIGMLEEIREKTGGNVAVMAKLFTSVEALKAALALGGTQYEAFNQVLKDFGNNAGAAERGFSAIARSDNKKWEAMLVVLKKIGTVLGDTTFQVLTLGGALDPLYEKLYSLGSGTIRTLANVAAVTVGMIGLKKAIDGVRGLGKFFEAAAVKGGHKTGDMLQVEAVKNAERLKALAKEKSDADRIVSEKRRHYLEMQNIARSTGATLAAENAKMAAARRSLQIAAANEAIRYQNWLNTGTGTFSPDPQLGVAQKTFSETEKSAQKAATAAATAQRNVRDAAKSYNEARKSAALATAAVQAHNASVAAGAANVGLLRGAWNSFTAAVAANPLGFALTVATLAITGIMYLLNRAEAKAEALRERVKQAYDKAAETRQSGDAEREKDIARIERLKELRKYTALTAHEQLEAQGIIDSLAGKYGNLGIYIDQVTGKLIAQRDAFAGVIEKMKEQRMLEAKEEYKAADRNLDTLKKRFHEVMKTDKTMKKFGPAYHVLTDGIGGLKNFKIDYKARADQFLHNPKLLERLAKDPNISADTSQLINEILKAYKDRDNAARVYQAAKGGDTDGKRDERIAEKARQERQEANQQAEEEQDILKRGDARRALERELFIENQYKLTGKAPDKKAMSEFDLKQEQERGAEINNAMNGKYDKKRIQELGLELVKSRNRQRELENEIGIAEAQNAEEKKNEERKNAEERLKKAKDGRDLTYTEMQARHRADGELSREEENTERETRIGNQRAEIADLARELSNAVGDELKENLRNRLADANLSLGNLLVEQKRQEGAGKGTAGSVYGSVLSAITGNPLEEKKVGLLEKIEDSNRKILQKGAKLTFGK